MNYRNQRQTLLMFFLLLANGLTVQAGEIRLKAEYRTGNVVRLGDIADFHNLSAEQTEQLKGVALFPAPAKDSVRLITAQQVSETLRIFGLELSGIQLHGQTKIQGDLPKEALVTNAIVPVTAETKNRVAKQLSEEETVDAALEQEALEHALAVVLDYLKPKDRLESEWTLKPGFTSEHALAVLAMDRPVASGGSAPYLGYQYFTVRDAAHPTKPAVYLKMHVTRTAQAVVPRRRLQPGEIVTEEVLEVREVPLANIPQQAVRQVDYAVGMEVTRPVPEGQVLHTASLRKPLVIKQGAIVKVFSVAAGVHVQSTAKAIANASQGDTLILETLDTNKRFQARATGANEAMVFVDVAKVSAPPVKQVTHVEEEPVLELKPQSTTGWRKR